MRFFWPNWIEMGSDPTRAYFWPAVNKRPAHPWPRHFLTQRKDIFLPLNWKFLKNLRSLGEIFQTQTQTKDGWPDPTRSPKYSASGSKNFDLGPSVMCAVLLKKSSYVVIWESRRKNKRVRYPNSQRAHLHCRYSFFSIICLETVTLNVQFSILPKIESRSILKLSLTLGSQYWEIYWQIKRRWDVSDDPFICAVNNFLIKQMVVRPETNLSQRHYYDLWITKFSEKRASEWFTNHWGYRSFGLLCG